MAARKKRRSKEAPGLPPETELEALLLGKLLKLAQGAQDQALDIQLRPYGMSRVQLGVLRHTSEGGAPMGELARELSCHVSNLTGVIDRMERDGLVERVRTPRDRRSVLVQLTAAGRKRRSVLLRELSPLQQSLTRGLSLAERGQLCRLLEKYIAGAQQQVDALRGAA